ncbi:MAG: polysaccharide biosynthesis protein [Desulfamplus sp.]|nr:polysaccharide biosynthesis protein [Desulfamplus sp.]
MLIQLKRLNFYLIFAVDMMLFTASFFFAHLIRFEFVFSELIAAQNFSLLPFVLLIKPLVYFFFDLYKGMFRYVGISDLWNLFKASLAATLLILFGIFMFSRFDGFSRAVLIIDWCLTFLLTGGLRLLVRYMYHKYLRQRDNGEKFTMFSSRKQIPILLIGAGNAGEKILREMIENPRLNYHVIGFIDDDSDKRGRSIHGIPVLGKVSELETIAAKHEIQEIIIAVPSATGVQMRTILDACKSCNISFKTMPGYGELIDGKVSVKTLRDVRYKDLLRRQPVELDSEKISDYLTEKSVMVTGAGGSIGSELCRQIIKFQPRKLILLDSSEAGLYSLQMELKHRAGYQRYCTVLGYVEDESLIDKVMKRYAPDVIFHAAAYKHVPMLERNPWQAVMNNIRGNHILIEKSLEYKVGHFVLVSTDKAVRPTNIMGASKRICELIVQSCYGNGTRMMAVRFGNVVGSAGSVIPLFREQIERGGPVTVTHPEVTRYFMTIPEASQLILQAGAQGEGGETFILEMGTSIKIVDMARDLIRLSGKEPDKDIEIRFTGLRQGEKLYEELITADEGVVSTNHEKIMVLRSNGNWNGLGSQENFRLKLNRQLAELYQVASLHDVCGIREKIKEIVPEYNVQESICVL